MEQHRDEQIVCADCGESFLFSAGEAAVFLERSLAAPKRCKECRRARKERAQGEGGAGARRPPMGDSRGPSFGPPRGPDPRGGRGPAPRRAPSPARYTGDVNEYRSPMQDTSFVAPQWRGAAPGQPRGARPSSRPFRDDGNSRAPSAPGAGRNGFAAPAAAPRAPRDDSASRRRPQGEVFSITCNSCGNQAEVPFKPAEGREVFCQACYRARKPA